MDGINLIKKDIELLINLVASTSLWASPIIVGRLFEEKNNPTASWCINARRFRKSKKEIKGFVNGFYLDSNTKANNAIKAALGLAVKPTNFATCHIYEKSTYDCKYHTSIPNLVLVPRPLYALTDHLAECNDFLKYYSFRQYGFYVGTKPSKPKFWSKIDLTNMIKPTHQQIEKALKSIDKRKRLIQY
jgi:hypothetical protein